MKTMSGRAALFLTEMGIGPLWQLRGRAEAEAELAPAGDDVVALEPDAAVAAPALAPAAPAVPVPDPDRKSVV